MFCRFCGFRVVIVWESYRTYRSAGYGYGSVTELTEVVGIVAQAYITHRSSGYGIPGRKVVPVPRVLSNRRTITHTRSRYAYERHTELTEAWGTGQEVLLSGT